MTRLGVVYPTRVSIWRREERANVLVEGHSTNSFEGAVGLSVSPAQAWRRGNPKAKHRKGRGAEKECWPAADGESRGQGGGRPAADRAAGLVSGSPRDVCVFARKQSGTESGDAPAGYRIHASRCRGHGRAPDPTRRPPRAPRIDAGQRHDLASGRRTRPGAALWATSSAGGGGEEKWP